MVTADREGVTPRELVDRNSEIIRDDFRRLGLSYDLFTRTTTANHHAVVRDVFRTLWERGASSRRRRSVRSLRPPAARFPIGTSRGRARSAAFPTRAATSATTAATSSILRISSTRARRSTASRRSSARRRTCFSICPPSRSGLRPGSRPRSTGVRTSGGSRCSSSGSFAAARSRATSTGASGSPCPVTRSATTSGSTSGSTQWSATSRPRSNGPPTVARRMPGASGGRGPRRATTTSWARTTSSSTA